MAKSNHAPKTHTAPGEIVAPGKLASKFLQRSLKSVWRLLKVAAWDWQTDAEHVHQLRVSARRVLAATHFFQELIPDSDRRWFRKKLKAVLRKTREARELDVLSSGLHHCEGAASKIAADNKETAGERESPSSDQQDELQDFGTDSPLPFMVEIARSSESC